MKHVTKLVQNQKPSVIAAVAVATLAALIGIYVVFFGRAAVNTAVCTKTLSVGGDVQAFVNTLAPGNVGCLSVGTYNTATVQFNTSGSSGLPITLRTVPNDQNAHAKIVLGNGMLFVPKLKNYITISDLDIDGSNQVTSSGFTNVRVEQSEGFVFERNDISNNNNSATCLLIGSGNDAAGVSKATIRLNKFHQCGRIIINGLPSNQDHSIYAAKMNDSQIVDNTFWKSSAYAIQVYPDSNRNTIANNVIDGGDGSNRGGIIVGPQYAGQTANDNTFRDNVVAYTTSAAFSEHTELNATTGNTMVNNCLYGNASNFSGSTAFKAAATGTVIATVAPFTHAHDMHLATGAGGCLTATPGSYEPGKIYDTAQKIKDEWAKANNGSPIAGTILWRADAEATTASEWASSACVPAAASPPNPDPTRINQNDFRAQGNKSYYFELRPGDDIYGNRCELGMAMPPNWPTEWQNHYFEEGDDRWIAMQYYFPADWPAEDKWNVVMQIKSSAVGGGGPNVGITTENNRIRFAGNSNLWGSTNGGGYIIGNGPLQYGAWPMTKGKWVKISMHVKFSADPAVGMLEAFGDLGDGNGVQTLVQPTSIPTMKLYDHDNNATTPMLPNPAHLRVGIYRDPTITTTGKLFVDGVTVATTREAAEANAFGTAGSGGGTTTPPPDTAPPTITWDAPAAGAIVSGLLNETSTPTCQVTPTDPSGIAKVEFYMDDNSTPYETQTTPPYTCVTNTALYPDGNHTIKAKAYDKVVPANVSSLVGRTLNFQNTLPDTTISSGPANPTTDTNASFAFTSNESGSTFECKLDAGVFVACPSPKAYTGLSAGSHTFTVQAKDSAGNTDTTPATWNWTVNTTTDTTPPTVNWEYPASGATVSGQLDEVTPPNCQVAATDASGIQKVDFYLDGVFTNSQVSAPYSCVINTANYPDGTHTLGAKATDKAGNVSDLVTRTVNFQNTTPDTTPPTVSINSPITGCNTATPPTCTGTITATATAYDPPSTTNGTGIGGVQFKLDGVNVGTEDTASPYTYTRNTLDPVLSNGTHTIEAIARDTSGLTTTSTATINVQNVDTVAPNPPASLSGTTTQPTSTTPGSVTLTWPAATDNGNPASGVKGYYVYRGTTVISPLITHTTATSYSYTDPNVLAGSYSYTVRSVDNVNLTSTTASPPYNTTLTAPPAPADTTPPTTPTNLTATAQGSTQVNLSWTASTDTSGIKGYNIYRNGSATPLNTTPVTTTTFGDGTVSPATTYTYEVEAIDGAGNKSPRSAPVSVNVPAPVIVAAPVVKEAETLTVPAGTTIITDSTASASKALRFYSNATATGPVSLPATATKLTVRAKGTYCNGYPQGVVKVDGVEVQRFTVNVASWADYSVPVSIAGGSHSVSISFTNDYTNYAGNSGNIKCSRDLDVDKVTLTGS